MSEETEKTPDQKNSRWALPHVFVLLFGIIVFAAIMTWILPAGDFNRVTNSAGQKIVQAGTYHLVKAHPVGFFEMFKCIYLGMKDAAPVILFLFIAYGFIGLIIGSGAFDGLVAKLLRVVRGRMRVLIIPLFMTVISFASSTVGISEEALPFIPIFVGITIAMGYDAIVGLAIVSCATAIGYAGAFMNPFTVGTAQAIAALSTGPRMNLPSRKKNCKSIPSPSVISSSSWSFSLGSLPWSMAANITAGTLRNYPPSL